MADANGNGARNPHIAIHPPVPAPPPAPPPAPVLSPTDPNGNPQFGRLPAGK